MRLQPPTSYQGGKQRLSKRILDIIKEEEQNEVKVLHDICCGSGAVGLEAVTRGIKVRMVDKGEYGLFWEKIGNDTFDMEQLKLEVDKLPSVEELRDYLQELSNEKVNEEKRVYHYLLLQAGSFGGKQIWEDKEKWCNNSFRSYWKPTETSKRRSPVNPMMPMPTTIIKRVQEIKEKSGYIEGYRKDVKEYIKEISLEEGEVFYIDPPYKGTTGYKDELEVEKIIKYLRQYGTVYVSEGYKIPQADKYIVLSKGRKKGNISGKRTKNPVEETLNIFYKTT